jgi:hypothetical protein
VLKGNTQRNVPNSAASIVKLDVMAIGPALITSRGAKPVHVVTTRASLVGQPALLVSRGCSSSAKEESIALKEVTAQPGNSRVCQDAKLVPKVSTPLLVEWKRVSNVHLVSINHAMARLLAEVAVVAPMVLHKGTQALTLPVHDALLVNSLSVLQLCAHSA